jgi:hypothetical protein
MPDYIPKPDGESQSYTDVLIAALELDEAAFGITVAQSLALREAHTRFEDALNAANTAKGAAQVAVAAKDTARTALEQLLRPIVAQIQVNPAVTDADRVAAGIPIRDTTRTFSAPVTPSGLVATADAAGTNLLKWSGAGNSTGIQFVVEAKVGSALEFSTVDVVTATTYRHTGRTPGQQVVYRVRARRGSALSDPSNVATVYAS